MEIQDQDMRLQFINYKSALSTFASSSGTFRILNTISSSPPSPPSTPSTLYILDSSFNPPTRAHLRIALSALINDQGALPKRLLLLLATQNADKAPKPASFAQRLALMSIFARDLQTAYSATSGTSPKVDMPKIDIGVTKCPYFLDKSSSITNSGLYPSQPTQVYLTGFDTLIRIMDPKYYPPTRTLAPLESFLSKHRLRVTYRADADWGDHSAQDRYLQDIADGKREHEGGKRDWANKIELVEGRKEGEEIVSSTRVREAIKEGNHELLRKLVTEGVAELVVSEKLYLEND